MFSMKLTQYRCYELNAYDDSRDSNKGIVNSDFIPYTLLMNMLNDTINVLIFVL